MKGSKPPERGNGGHDLSNYPEKFQKTFLNLRQNDRRPVKNTKGKTATHASEKKGNEIPSKLKLFSRSKNYWWEENLQPILGRKKEG